MYKFDFYLAIKELNMTLGLIIVVIPSICSLFIAILLQIITRCLKLNFLKRLFLELFIIFIGIAYLCIMEFLEQIRKPYLNIHSGPPSDFVLINMMIMIFFVTLGLFSFIYGLIWSFIKFISGRIYALIYGLIKTNYHKKNDDYYP